MVMSNYDEIDKIKNRCEKYINRNDGSYEACLTYEGFYELAAKTLGYGKEPTEDDFINAMIRQADGSGG
jgi:hypothetical protein